MKQKDIQQFSKNKISCKNVDEAKLLVECLKIENEEHLRRIKNSIRKNR